jgi:hypothetical protein
MGARALGFVSLTVWLFVERLSHWDRFVYRRQHDGAADARFYFFSFLSLTTENTKKSAST